VKKGYKRLLKLADHLESDKRGHDKFDFGRFSGKTLCGTAGCALGECPTIWKTWTFRLANGSSLPCIGDMAPSTSAECWFDISEDAARHLFFALRQKPVVFGGKYLEGSATATEVAENIRAFVKLKS